MQNFIAWLTERLGALYIWGAQGECGELLTEDFVRIREKRSSSDSKTVENNIARVLRFMKKQRENGVCPLYAYDCSGLIVDYMLKNALISHDTTADGLYRMSVRFTDENSLTPGDLVFRHNGTKATHVGVFTGTHVIHARGRDYGVVRETLKQNGETYWNAYGRIQSLCDAAAFSEPKSAAIDSRILKLCEPYMRGDDVLRLQQRLTELGFDAGGVDGVFGKRTHKAVLAFQKAYGLKEDGIAGEKTLFALFASCAPAFAEISRGSVNLRRTGSAQSEIVAVLREKDRLLALPPENGWRRVCAFVGSAPVDGFVSDGFLEEVS